MNESDRFRDVLKQISELASSAASGEGASASEGFHGASVAHGDRDACTLRFLPARLLVKAAEVAQRINPVNAPVLGPLAAVGAPASLDKMRIAVLTSKYWGPASRKLTVSFMESAPSNLRGRILQHMNAWSTKAGISFVETNGDGDVRISRGSGGYWSYLGTDIKLVPTNHQTMNLEGFTTNTPDSEYKRVVRHETGHTLGFPHEHMRRELVARIDPAKAYPYFLATQGWDKHTVDQQVLTPLDESSIFGTPPDQTSIMCYQLPGSITFDGQPITGGTDVNTTDYFFAALIYPKFFFEEAKAGRREKPEREEELAPTMAQAYAQDWGASQDPEVRT